MRQVQTDSHTFTHLDRAHFSALVRDRKIWDSSRAYSDEARRPCILSRYSKCVLWALSSADFVVMEQLGCNAQIIEIRWWQVGRLRYWAPWNKFNNWYPVESCKTRLEGTCNPCWDCISEWWNKWRSSLMPASFLCLFKFKGQGHGAENKGRQEQICIVLASRSRLQIKAW